MRTSLTLPLKFSLPFHTLLSTVVAPLQLGYELLSMLNPSLIHSPRVLHFFLFHMHVLNNKLKDRKQRRIDLDSFYKRFFSSFSSSAKGRLESNLGANIRVLRVQGVSTKM